MRVELFTGAAILDGIRILQIGKWNIANPYITPVQHRLYRLCRLLTFYDILGIAGVRFRRQHDVDLTPHAPSYFLQRRGHPIHLGAGHVRRRRLCFSLLLHASTMRRADGII